MVSSEKRALHRRGRNLEGLDEEDVDEGDHDDGEDYGVEPVQPYVVLLPLLVLLLPESPLDLLGDEDVKNHKQSEQPPVILDPKNPEDIKYGPETEPYPFVPVYSLQRQCSKLFDRVHNSLESLGIVHRQVSENLAVEADILLCELAHKLGVVHSVLACSRVDTGDPEGTECALLSFAVAVCVGQTFFVGILGYGPDVLPGEEVTAGFL